MPDYDEEVEPHGQSYLSLAPLSTISHPGTAAPTVTTSKRKRSTSKCQLCGEAVKWKFKRHFQHRHLPWYTDPHTACWTCRTNEGSLAHLHAQHPHTTLTDDTLILWLGACAALLHKLVEICGCHNLNSLLLKTLKDQNFPTDSIEINPITTIFWQMLELYFQIPVTSKFVLNPPNSVVALLHPSILRHVLKNVGSEQLEELRGMCNVTTPKLPHRFHRN